MTKQIALSTQGKEKLEKELLELKSVRRSEVIDRIKRAKDYGDLSENAEYEDARNEQSFIEGRIQELEYLLKYGQVSKNCSRAGSVCMGSKVSVEMDGGKMVYEIVDSTEADPIEGKISGESPIGSALMGHKAKEIVEANIPAGRIKLKILKIE